MAASAEIVIVGISIKLTDDQHDADTLRGWALDTLKNVTGVLPERPQGSAIGFTSTIVDQPLNGYGYRRSQPRPRQHEAGGAEA